MNISEGVVCKKFPNVQTGLQPGFDGEGRDLVPQKALAEIKPARGSLRPSGLVSPGPSPRLGAGGFSPGRRPA